MSRTYRGGFIRATAPTVNSSSASGIFTMGDAMQYKNASLWPTYVPSANIVVNSTTYTLYANNTAQLFTSNGYYTVVPSTNMTVRLQLWGAGGGGGQNSGPSKGAAGGYVEGEVTLTSGTSYVFLIGQYGACGGGAAFPDGGSSPNNGLTGSGGGSTRFGAYTQSGFNITNSSTDYNNTSAVYYLIAGGGGGGSDWSGVNGTGTYGGFGGGTTGQAGGRYYDSDGPNSPGLGGTQSAGGNGGYGGRVGSGSAGAKYSGGAGGGAGGGGGYYGGGGSAGYYAIGGGGSGFINSGVVSSGLFYTTTTGETTYYVSPNPRSNKPGTAGDGGNLTGSHGAVGITLIA